MGKPKSPDARAGQDADAPESPSFRSSAVARMLGMPVATLRVWERRYALCKPPTTASGQRLYTPADVQRLALLKRLTDVGHAIGQLATLDTAALHTVAATHATALANAAARPALAAPAARRKSSRVVLIGAGWGARLQRPTVRRHLGRHIDCLGPFESASHAAAALSTDADRASVQALLVHAPSLTPHTWSAIESALPLAGHVAKAVVYGYAAASTTEPLATAGVALLREPQNDRALGQWLRGVLAASDAAPSPSSNKSPAEEPTQSRWSDAALSDFAGLSTTVACECPKHVAELLIQLAQFEAYSADCENRHPADAQLHAHLARVAAQARADFENALEYVALHEGLTLPREAV